MCIIKPNKNFSKFLAFVILLLSFVSLPSRAQKKKVKIAKWQTEPIKIDGEIEQEIDPFNLYNKETKLAYSIANDASHIYLSFKVIDEFTQIKILRAGLTVMIDTLGKRKHSISISYPLQGYASTNNTNPREKKPDFEEVKAIFRAMPQRMKLSGFKSGNGTSNTINANGVAVYINWDENKDLIYEISIPINSFWGNEVTASKASKTIALNVIINALDKSNVSNSRPANAGGSRPAGGGSPGGGGRPPGVGGPPSGAGANNLDAYNRLFSEQKMHTKFRLSIN